MSRIYPVVLLLGLVLMAAGAATTYVALGQDGENPVSEEASVAELLLTPTPTLEPTFEAPPVLEAPPVQPVVQQPAPPVVEVPPVQPVVEQPAQPVVEAPQVIEPVVVEEANPVADEVTEPEAPQVSQPVEVVPTVDETNAAPVVEIVVEPEQTEAIETVENEPVPDQAAAEQTPAVEEPVQVVGPEQTEAVEPVETVPEPADEAAEPTVDPGTIPTLDGIGTGQSASAEVPTVGPENPLEEVPALEPTSEATEAEEIPAGPDAEPLPTETPADLAEAEIPAEETEAVQPSTQVRGSASGAFGQLQGITLTLTQPDGTIVEAITDEQGSFSFEGLLPGDYTLSARMPGALTSQAVFTLTEGQQFELPPAVLAIGDLNQDNRIDMNDVVLLAANYNYPAEAAGVDLNGDSWIDISDLAIIGAQFGAVGPLPWQ